MRNRWSAKKRFEELVRSIHDRDYNISEAGMKFLWDEYDKWDRQKHYRDTDIKQWYEMLLEINNSGSKKRSLERTLTY